MPITLGSISRRRFIAGSVGAALVSLLRPRFAGAADIRRDANRLALLSDTHINRDPAKVANGANMADHLRTVVERLAELAKADGAPAVALVNGDLAHVSGEAEDYQQLVRLLAPLREAKLPVSMSLGNHDSRERFWQAVEPVRRETFVDQRHILLLELPRVDWVVLDSLDKVNSTPGVLGPEQLAWLKAVLDHPKRADRPCVVMVHHNPDPPTPAATTAPATVPSTRPAKVSGLVETQALFDLLLPRKRVKALIYGHRHVWECRQVQGLHLVGLPAVAYTFDKAQPTGWIDCRLADTAGMRLELRCVDNNHPRHGEVVELAWR